MAHKYFHCELDEDHVRNRLDSSGLMFTKNSSPHPPEAKALCSLAIFKLSKRKFFPTNIPESNIPEHEKMFKVYSGGKTKVWLCC